jgi:diguanylate cyclase (GGDEF)-like protein/PAS domain S-box-containing protein
MPAQPEPSPVVAIAEEEVGTLLVDLVDHLDAMVAYWDSEERCRFANQAYKDWFGRGRQELLGISLSELLGPLYEMNRPYIEAAYRGERQVFERAIPRLGRAGVRNSLATYIPRVVEGRIVGMFVHVADVEPLKSLEWELKAARDQAERLATHDFLTGLPNRLFLQDRMVESIGRAKRTKERLFALSIDVDHFKSVNDTYGHAAGDALLIEMAARIKSCVRDYDTVARLGGDEFFVLTGDIGLAEGIEGLARRLLQTANRPCEIEQRVLAATLSIGIAEFPRHGVTREALMDASDRALYAAKRAGRNCFRLAEGDAPSVRP